MIALSFHQAGVGRGMAGASLALARAVALGVALLAAAVSLVAHVRPAAAEFLSSGGAVSLEVNKGRLIRLREAAATVLVADPAIADVQIKSPNMLYVFGKKPGETSLFAVDARDRVLLNVTVTVNHNLSRLQRTLRMLMPEERIEATSVDGAIVLTGSVKSSAVAENAREVAAQFVADEKDVINRINVVGPTQVQLRVKFVEMSRSVNRQLGINWDAVFQAGSSFVLGFATGGATTVSGTFPPPFPIGTRENGVNNFFATYQGQRYTVTSLIDALETEGLAKTLAEPNLTALSGEVASFLAGGEFPIPVPQNESDAITVVFKEFGVRLSFTPTILSSDRISLKVEPEVSQLTSAGAVQLEGFSIPGLTTRRAATTVELGSGQTFAIAGLLQNDLNNNISKVPGLGDIPVLGELFKSTQYQRNETELVVLVTPVVVKPFADKTETASAVNPNPDAPSDINRLFLGPRIEGQPRRDPTQPGGGPVGAPTRLHGSAGFVLE
ncbi:MAG TPA: type II and III secretion system protein family protein [Alphaproteobacteria bacterium]